MPHICIIAHHDDRVMKTVKIHVSVDFKHDYFIDHRSKAYEKLTQLQKDLENVVHVYFDDFESDAEMSNHNYNVFHRG